MRLHHTLRTINTKPTRETDPIQALTVFETQLSPQSLAIIILQDGPVGLSMTGRHI